MARLTLKKPDAKFYRGWGFVALLTIALTIAVFASRGGFETVGSGQSDPSGCRMEATGDGLNVRAQPNINAPVVETLRRGDLRPAEKIVENGFRKLAEGRWASEQFLSPLPGSTCR
ncbi:MAG: SH3 domain-containing protein [Pseudonocardiales bacterium]|nr:SH3 domain-containing protein [Pseudonocardiales bacterium]